MSNLSKTCSPEIIEHLAFLVSSATGCIDEPKIYGSLRLIDATERLITLLGELEICSDKRLDEIAQDISERKHLCMTDEVAFKALLNRTSEQLVDILLNSSL